ncbi:MAG: ABC transporter substrate-binding protein [Anaerolineales bacterium]
MALGIAGCAGTPRSSAILHYGLTLSPTGIDPHLNASAELGIPLSSVYDTLVVQDPTTGEFMPGLAEDWSISEDGRDYTFHLRRGVTFHDGTPLDADAVLANLEYTVDPDHHSQKAVFMLGPFERGVASDPMTVVLHLSQPYAPLLDSLSQVYLGMASPSALRQWGPEAYPFHQVGSGPFQFVDYVPNDRLTISRSSGYGWAPAVVAADQAALAGVEFRFYEDPPTRALALESGQVDIVGEVPPQDARRLVDSGEFQIYPVAIPGQPMQVLFNLMLAPTDDPRVRQALVLAVDREAVVDTVFGGMSPVARGILTRNILGFSLDLPMPAYDPLAAATLLDEAGWNWVGRIRMREGAPLHLNLVVPNWGSHPEVAQLLQIAWESLGAAVDVEVAAGFGPLREAQAEEAYNAIAWNTFGTDPDLLTPFFETGGLYNWMGLSDPDVDEWLERGRSTTDPAVRAEAYSEISRRAMDGAWVLPIRDYVDLVVAHQRVQGLRYSPQGWFPYLIDFSLAP